MIAVATTPTVYGIETEHSMYINAVEQYFVATTPTVYGIETRGKRWGTYSKRLWLQQHLPFTVLKHQSCRYHG